MRTLIFLRLKAGEVARFTSTGHVFSVVQVSDDFCTAWAMLVSCGGVTIVGVT